MVEAAPWLTIVGIGEDGMAGLSLAARSAIERAELVTGAARHIALVPGLTCKTIVWPVPFEAGIAALLASRGRRVVMLASGDPFWFGAGTVLAGMIEPADWVAHPAPSSFALAAARLGWALEGTACFGLHAAPFARMRSELAAGGRLLATVRDGTAVAGLAEYVTRVGFGASTLHVLEALGGPRERVRQATADTLTFKDIAHPVMVAIEIAGHGPAVPRCSGLPDLLFAHDGQITKRAVRALTLSALAPRPGETLWDIGAGSGSIAIEWLLTHPACEATAIEHDPTRAARARLNAAALGVDRLAVVEGMAPDALDGLATPDAVFVGGGLSPALLDALWDLLPCGTRLVANAVTIESEALLADRQAAKGGSLLRIELADAAPLGTRRGWRARYPVLQWSVVL